MTEKKRVCIWTIAAAVSVCLELVIISLTPVARIGNGTRFNTPGMYYNVFMAGGSYLIPLAIYCADVNVMKYIIGVMNAICIIAQPVIMAIMLWGEISILKSGVISVTCMLALCMAAGSLIIEIMWYPMCRRKKV